MKELTGKAKEEFDKFLYDKYEDIILKEEQEIYWGHYAREVTLWDVYEKLSLELQQATLISWLDSVGIYVSPNYEEYIDDSVRGLPIKIKNWFCWVNEELLTGFSSRQQATEKAIIKAVDIYNNRGN